MDLNCPIQLEWNGNFYRKWVDRDMYSYMELIADIYNTILRHVQEGQTVSFTITAEVASRESNRVTDDASLTNILLSAVGLDIVRFQVSDLQCSQSRHRKHTINGQPSIGIRRSDTMTESADFGMLRPQSPKPQDNLESSSQIDTDQRLELVHSSYFQEENGENDDDDDDFAGDGHHATCSDDSTSVDDENENEGAVLAYPYVDNLVGGLDDGLDDAPIDTTRFEFTQGDVFDNATAFREAIRNYVIQQGFERLYERNDPNRIIAVCKSTNCSWRITATRTRPTSNTDKSITVREYNNRHSCIRSGVKRSISSTWVADKISSYVHDNPDISVHTLQSILKGMGIHNIKYMTVWRAKEVAMYKVLGSYEKSYKLLPGYAKLLDEHVSGSFMFLQYEERVAPPLSPPLFKRVFVCFRACKEGFKRGCRPLLFIDGCHLKGKYGGICLSAVSVDGNNGVLPIAIGVVESENKESWLYFLDCLCRALQLDLMEHAGLTFIFDRQKGLADVVSMTFPYAYQRLCCRRFYENFRKLFPSPLLRLHFWCACKSYTRANFDIQMGHIKDISNDAYEWLMKTPLHLWARHAFDVRGRCDHVTSNNVETFNKWLGDLRYAPILSFIDGFRERVNEKIMRRYGESIKYTAVGHVTPYIRTTLDIIQHSSRECIVHPCSEGAYEVIDMTSRRFVVRLREKYCDCGVWLLTGLPCKHVAAVILLREENIEMCCDDYYTVEKYCHAYDTIVAPLPDVSTIPLPPSKEALQPPRFHRLPGRPKKQGIPSEGEKQRRCKTCSICNQSGHTRRKCQRAHVGSRVNNGPTQGRQGSQRMTRSQPHPSAVAPLSVQDKIIQKNKRMAENKRAKRKASSNIQQGQSSQQPQPPTSPGSQQPNLG